jgi:serine-type D-Ala-D-Ala carboxypeptidase/endopeptidase
MKFWSTSVSMLLLCSLWMHAGATKSENPTAEKTATLKDKFVSDFNRAEYANFYASGSDAFKSSTPRNQFVSFLKNDIAPFGRIVSSPLIDDLGEVKLYRLEFDDKGKTGNLQLSLGEASPSRFHSFAIGNLPRICDESSAPVTDNPLRSKLDISVHASVLRYFCDGNNASVSIAIADHGAVSTYHYAKQGGPLPNDDTVFEIGSNTKTFTGILLAQAVIDGKISLDDDIRKFLPGEFPNLEFQGKSIPVRSLITHTSGVPSYTESVDADNDMNPWQSFTSEKMLGDLHRIRLTRAPGSMYEYSNVGTALVGLVLEKAYGESYESLLRKFILKPAGMTSTGLNLIPDKAENLAQAHAKDGTAVPNWIINGIEAAGAIRSSAADMGKYMLFNLNENNAAAKLSHQRLPTASGPPIGFAWGAQQSPTGYHILSHEGGTNGSSASLRLLPDQQIGIAVLSNTGSKAPRKLAYEIGLRMLKENAAD